MNTKSNTFLLYIIIQDNNQQIYVTYSLVRSNKNMAIDY